MPVMRSIGVVAIALVVAAASSGCLADIFVDTNVTTREFACDALSDARVPELLLDVRVDESLALSPVAAVDHLRQVLGDLPSRSMESIGIRVTAIEAIPDAWDDDAWAEELDGHRVRDGLRSMRLTIYWVADLAGSGTGDLVAPGVVAIDVAGLQAKIRATDAPQENVTRGVLLHHVGHALGGVNQGIPMQANHEGAPGHDRNVSSVMHHGLHDANDPTWGPYGGFDAAMRADWEAALNDPLVCP